MANAKLTLNVTDHWTDGKRVHVIGFITNDGGNYAVGGLALSLANPLIKGSYLLHASVFAKAALYYITDVNGAFPEDDDTLGVGGAIASNLLLWGYSVPGTQLAVAVLPDTKIKFYGIYSKLI
jgi:hypothetical protein